MIGIILLIGGLIIAATVLYPNRKDVIEGIGKLFEDKPKKHLGIEKLFKGKPKKYFELIEYDNDNARGAWTCMESVNQEYYEDYIKVDEKD